MTGPLKRALAGVASRPLSPLAVAVLLGVTTASCGGAAGGRDRIPARGPLPAGVVAAVGRVPISATSFEHWFAIAYNEMGVIPSHEPLPSPPAYTTCVAALRGEEPQSRRSAAALRSACARDYARAHAETIGFLVRAQWLVQEGEARHVSVGRGALGRAIAGEIGRQDPGPGAFARFLAKAGMSRADFDFSVRVNAIAEALQRRGSPRVLVSAAQVARYYREHRSRYASPPRLSTLMIVTDTRAAALAARAALLSGRGWAAVAERFSRDSSKRAGGEFAIVPGQQDPSLERAAFSAPRGRIEGPVRAPQPAVLGGGSLYYVFEVTGGSRSGSRRPLSDVAGEIKRTISERLHEQSLTSLVSDFRTRWRARTRCRAGYVIAECRNGPSLAAGSGI
jgi:foldase protein PrsA